MLRCAWTLPWSWDLCGRRFAVASICRTHCLNRVLRLSICNSRPLKQNKVVVGGCVCFEADTRLNSLWNSCTWNTICFPCFVQTNLPPSSRPKRHCSSRARRYKAMSKVRHWHGSTRPDVSNECMMTAIIVLSSVTLGSTFCKRAQGEKTVQIIAGGFGPLDHPEARPKRIPQPMAQPLPTSSNPSKASKQTVVN